MTLLSSTQWRSQVLVVSAEQCSVPGKLQVHFSSTEKGSPSSSKHYEWKQVWGMALIHISTADY